MSIRFPDDCSSGVVVLYARKDLALFSIICSGVAFGRSSVHPLLLRWWRLAPHVWHTESHRMGKPFMAKLPLNSRDSSLTEEQIELATPLSAVLVLRQSPESTSSAKHRKLGFCTPGTRQESRYTRFLSACLGVKIFCCQCQRNKKPNCDLSFFENI